MCSCEQYTVEEIASQEWMKMLHRDMERINENIYATCLEVFHSLKISYVPKKIFYEQDKMVAGTEMSALDFNNNVLTDLRKFFTLTHRLFSPAMSEGKSALGSRMVSQSK